MGGKALTAEELSYWHLMGETGYTEGWTHSPLRPEVLSFYGLLFTLQSKSNDKDKRHKILPLFGSITENIDNSLEGEIGRSTEATFGAGPQCGSAAPESL